MFVDKKVTVVRTERCSIELDEKIIRQLVQVAGAQIPEDANVRIYFAVPGGGDWSNTEIDIDNQHPIYVEWTKTEESRG